MLSSAFQQLYQRSLITHYMGFPASKLDGCGTELLGIPGSRRRAGLAKPRLRSEVTGTKLLNLSARPLSA
jgi:hypothetical protein